MKQYLAKMEESSVRMTQLIQHLLDFANITHQAVLYEKTSLNEIFHDILKDFELLIAEKKAVITCENLPDIEAILFHMHQLFYDLVSNALKFSRKDVACEIKVSAHMLTGDELKSYPGLNQKLTYYEIVFKDNGIGFEQKYAQQIFTMFQRLEVSGNYAGTGMGLALCKKIVQNYHGEIFAVGKKNVGASFHVILPVKQPTAQKTKESKLE